MRSGRQRTTLVVAAAALAGVSAWGAPLPPRPAAKPTPAPASPKVAAVATVGTLSVARGEFDQRVAQAVAEYHARSGANLPPELKPVIERQLLESLIRVQLLVLEARRRGIQASDAEAEEVLKQDPFFQEAGHFNPAKFAAVKTTQPQQFESAIRNIRDRLGARLLSERLEAHEQPDSVEIRARAGRLLSRATLEYLALRRSEFSGTAPEPRESEILAAYREHAGDYRRPDRAALSVVFVNEPALPESLHGNEGARLAWGQRMKQRADSALAAVRGGASFEVVATPFAGPRRNVVVMHDNLPGFWKGSPAVTASIFQQRAGAVLPDPVPADDGWLLVRVDEVTPAHVAPLREVAREIRGRLRGEVRLHHDDRELRALYDVRRDSLAGPAYRVRYAVADTGVIAVGEPTAADLDRYYRGHLADYSSFDAAGGSIVARPLAEVRDEIRGRWLRERRIEAARALAEQITETWGRGRRDPGLERSARLVREVGPVPPGAPIDTGLAGAALTDTLSRRGLHLGLGAFPFSRGTIVFQVVSRVEAYVPTFEQARPVLARELVLRRDRENEQGARQLYDADPGQFATGNVLHFARFAPTTPAIQSVPLTRKEVEDYHRRHLDKYSAPETMRARHILIGFHGTGPAAEAAARARADSVLRRVNAGEDFARLAAEVSDDGPTKDQGGDLGTFGRGAMLDAFEKAAFALKPGEHSGLVKTEVGFHIIECVEHQPAVVQPLVQAYANVAGDAAAEKADSLAKRTADSLFRVIRTPAQARAAAARLGVSVLPYERTIGETPPQGLRDYFAVLDRLKPGHIYPGVQYVRGLGFAISWVDSLSPPARPSWEQARARALDRYRRGAGERGLGAKRAELDSLLSSGWSLDSLATLWGGLDPLTDIPAGTALPGLGGREILDSLVFGAPGRAPVLGPGATSDWATFPLGLARIRLQSLKRPAAEQLSARVESERRIELERRMSVVYEELKKRYPVRILDRELRDVALPPLPEP